MGSASVSSDAGPTLRSVGCPFGQVLRAVATVIISVDFAHRVSLGLAAGGLTWACLAFFVAARFLRRSAPRGPPLLLF